MPASLLSRHFRAGEVMSRHVSPNPANNLPATPNAVTSRSLHRYFRAEKRALECLDRVVERVHGAVGPAASTSATVIVLDGYWTASDAQRKGVAVHATGGGVTRPRHQAGTAFRITLGTAAHDPALYGPLRPSDSELLELVNAVVVECGPYIQEQQYGLGLALHPDSVYFDIRRRPSATRLVEAWAMPGAALSTIDLQRWVDSGSRPIQQERCSRPPKPHPHRQSQGYTSPRPRPAAGGQRRRAAAEEASNRTRARTNRQAGVTDIDGEFCDLSSTAREMQCNAAVDALQNLAGTRPENSVRFERMSAEFLACCTRCSRGGLIAGLFSNAREEKERSCDQAVHWLPITFSAPQTHIDACTFYPHGHDELQRSACFWGTCIDETSVAQVILPPFRGTFTASVGSGVAGAGVTTEQTDPEPLFDNVLNPSPILQVLQRTFAMHCTGPSRVWVDTAEDIRNMRHTIVALMGYNPEVSIVEFQLGPDADYFSIVDSLETLLEDWETSLCREHARDFLAPYVIVQPTQVSASQTGATADSLHVTEANPQIMAVSVVRRVLDLTWSQREGFEDFDQEVMPAAYGLLLDTEVGPYLLEHGFTTDAACLRRSFQTAATTTLAAVSLDFHNGLRFSDDASREGQSRKVRIEAAGRSRDWVQFTLTDAPPRWGVARAVGALDGGVAVSAPIDVSLAATAKVRRAMGIYTSRLGPPIEEQHTTTRR